VIWHRYNSPMMAPIEFIDQLIDFASRASRNMATRGKVPRRALDDKPTKKPAFTLACG